LLQSTIDDHSDGDMNVNATHFTVNEQNDRVYRTHSWDTAQDPISYDNQEATYVLKRIK